MDTDAAAQLIVRAAKEGGLIDVLDWDVIVAGKIGQVAPELWDQLKGKIVVILGGIHPEGEADEPAMGAGVYALSLEDARGIAMGLAEMVDKLQPRTDN